MCDSDRGERHDSQCAALLTIGIDLDDKHSHVCVLDAEGTIVEESRLQTKREQPSGWQLRVRW